MKKTQSLKLMLLGLFAAVSTGAWAQYTAVKGVVYGLNEAEDGAVVLGVIQSKLTPATWGGLKAIEIEDVVTIKGAPYKVVDFDFDWKTAREFANDPVSGSAGSNTNPTDPGLNDGSEWVVTPGQGATAPSAQTVYKTADATKIADPLELILRATDLDEITIDDIFGLNIASFVLGGESGISVIPENLFTAKQVVRVSNAEERDAAIAAANAKLNGTVNTGKDTDCLLKDYFVKEGKINGEQAYVNVDGNYLVVNEAITEQHVTDGPFLHPAYIYEKVDGTFKKKVDANKKDVIAAWVTIKSDKLWENGTTAFATKVTDNLESTCIDGSKAKYEKAKAAYDQAVKDEDKAMKDWAAAVTAAENGAGGNVTPDVAAKGEAAQKLKNAILAIENDPNFSNLQKQVTAQLGTAVQDQTAWFCGYALANNLVNTTIVPEGATAYDNDGTYWNTKTQTLIDKFVAFYGTDTNAIPATPVTAYKFTSFGATKVNGNGKLQTNNLKFIFPSEGINFNQFATGLVADQTADVDEENVAAKELGLSKVKVLTNNPDPAENPFKDKVFYVQIDPKTKTINPNTYYVLFMKNPKYPNESATPFIPVAEGATEGTPDQTWNATGEFTPTNVDENPNVGKLTLSWKNGTTFMETSYVDGVTKYEYTEGVHYLIIGGDDDDSRVVITAKYVKGNSAWCMDESGNVYKLTNGTQFDQPNPSEPTYTAAAKLVSRKIAGTPATADMVMCVKIGASQNYALVPEPGIAPEILASAPYKDIENALKAWMPKSEDELAQDVKDKKKAWDEAITNTGNKKEAMDRAKEQMEADERALADAQKIPEFKNEYRYDADGQNPDLTHVAFNHPIVTTIGARAFANCVNAKFSNGTFHPTLKSIGKEAFRNTLLDNLDLRHTGEADWRGDQDENGKFDVDEEGNLIGDDAVNVVDRLNDEDIAYNAFLGTPLKYMYLEDTNLSAGWVKSVADGLKKEKSIRYADECDATQYYTRYKVNTTLETVTLPGDFTDMDLTYNKGHYAIKFDKILPNTFANFIKLAAIAIPAQVITIGKDAFCGDDALASITFAAEKSELKTIGEGAFYHAAATQIDLSKQTELETIGDNAFADMKSLTTVILTNTKVASLPASVFDGDALLATVTFYDATDAKSTSNIEFLPEGLFRTNAIAVLDIAKTKIKVLNNLFQAGDGSLTLKYTCNGEQKTKVLNPRNYTLTAVKLPACLQKIEDGALSHMFNEAFTTVEVPGSVFDLGEGVFYDDANLTTVSFFNYTGAAEKKDFQEGSRLTCLPANTFASCPKLQDVYIVTYDTPAHYCFGDNVFHSAGTANTPEAGTNDRRTRVHVTYDAYMTLTHGYSDSPVGAGYSSTYSKLMPFDAKMTGMKIGDEYYKPWTSKFGTWIKAVDEGEDAVGVYTAYQNGNKVSLYPAKKIDFEGVPYYKIAAYDDDAAMAAVWNYTHSTGTTPVPGGDDPTPAKVYVQAGGRMYVNVEEGKFEVFAAPAELSDLVVDDDDDDVELSWYTYTIVPSYQYYYYDEDGVKHVLGTGRSIQFIFEDGAVPTQITKLIEQRLTFGNFGAWKNFEIPTDVAAKTWMALGTAIVVSAKATVPYLQMTDPDRKYQSTLDLANQLSVTHIDVSKANENNFYYVYRGTKDGKQVLTFKHHDDNSVVDILPRGSVVFETTGPQGQGVREFDVEFVSENEATAINGVVERSLNDSETIYNVRGMKVTAPVKGQMYIKGGQKFIQK